MFTAFCILNQFHNQFLHGTGLFRSGKSDHQPFLCMHQELYPPNCIRTVPIIADPCYMYQAFFNCRQGDKDAEKMAVAPFLMDLRKPCTLMGVSCLVTPDTVIRAAGVLETLTLKPYASRCIQFNQQKWIQQKGPRIAADRCTLNNSRLTGQGNSSLVLSG